jgi:5-methylcytosine-specific restriction protein A
MPLQAKRCCRNGTCPETTTHPTGLCDSCRRLKYQRQGKQRSEDHRFYSTAIWRRLRAMQLAREPLCRHCEAEGFTVLATEVDHITPILISVF